MTEQDVADQVDALNYCNAGDTEDILAASMLSKEEQEAFDKVIDMLENHFIGKRNIIYERARFNQEATRTWRDSGSVCNSFAQTGVPLRVWSSKR